MDFLIIDQEAFLQVEVVEQLAFVVVQVVLVEHLDLVALQKTSLDQDCFLFLQARVHEG